MNGRVGALKPGKLGLRCKANRRLDWGPRFANGNSNTTIGDAGSTRPRWKPPQVQVSDLAGQMQSTHLSQRELDLQRPQCLLYQVK